MPKMRYIAMKTDDIRTNLATEQYLMNSGKLEPPFMLFYIEKPCIIVGRNQNTLEEINQKYCQEHNITITRRLSGGGAMYQDLGNMCFSFVVQADKQKFGDFKSLVKPVVDALHEMGATEAEVTGRNDIVIDGKKFSGNAMYSRNGKTFSHGTLMFDVNTDSVADALNVPKDKIESKGIKSVRSRVTNIKPYLKPEYQELDTYQFRDELIKKIWGVATIEEAKASGKPSLIEVKTVIGYGSPNKQGTNAVHGAPLGADETAATRQALGWDYEPFEIPEQVYADFKEHVADRGASAYEAWTKLVADYKEAHPELAAEVEAIIDGRDPVEVTPADFPALENGFSQATRNSSQDALNVVAAKLPTFLGGSADLAHSNMTYIKTDGLQDDANRLNRNIQFGVREFAMGTILNGMALHGGLRVYGGTFFVFSDYVKAAVRLSALQGLPVTYVFTHDSIAVGEDGPTHEPVEHLAGLRAMPNLNVFRPADARETQAAWYLAVTSEKTPTALVLTRQNLTVEEGTDFDKVAKGAYVVYENAADFDTILIATGSEVNLAVSAAKELASQGAKVRVVSMSSTDVFDKQDAAYKEEILPNAVRRRVAVEMGATQNWYKYVGLDGAVLGIDTFGASAPAPKVLAEYGFTVENLVKVVQNLK